MRRLLLLGIVLAVLVSGVPAMLQSAGEPLDIVSLRTANSKTFYANGNFTKIITSKLHYWDNGWNDLNNQIVGVTPPWNYQMVGDDYTARFLSNFQAGQILQWESDGQTVAFQPMALEWTNSLDMISQISMPQNTASLVTNTPLELIEGVDTGYQQGTIRWNNGYGAGRDFWWTCQEGRLAKVLKLTTPLPVPPSYITDQPSPAARLNFIFDPSSGLVIYVNGALWDKKTTKQTVQRIDFKYNGETLWYFEPATCWDSLGNTIVATTEVRKSGGSLYVSVRVPYSWLQTAVYPVFIDPTLTLQPDPTEGKDSYMTQFTPDTNWGTQTRLDVQSYSFGGGSNIRAILEFDVSDLFGIEIGWTSATLSMYYFSMGLEDPVGRTYWAYKVTRTNWTEGGVTWNKYDGSNSWTAQGGDYVTSSPSGGSTTVPAGFGWMNWDVLAITQDAVTNEIPVELLVKDGTENSATQYYCDFYSSDYLADTSKRPKLVIIYTLYPPTVDTLDGTDEAYNSFTANGDITNDRGFDVARRGFGYTTVYDDFEWGNDGDGLDDNGGHITWAELISGTATAEISTDQHISGTRSAEFTLSGTGVAGGQLALESGTDTCIFLGVMKGDSAALRIDHGDGVHMILLRYNTDETLAYYDSDYHTIATLTHSTWHTIDIRDIDWGGATYNVYADGVLVADGVTMRTNSSTADVVNVYVNAAGTTYVDDVYIWVLEDELGSFGEGAYDLEITGLDPNTTYQVQAFAENAVGIGYGDIVQVLTAPAAPTNVVATDGDHSDKVTITWTKSSGADDYQVYRDGTPLGWIGDLDSYDDTGAGAPTITSGTASASDGTGYTEVTLSIDGEVTNNGTTHTYKVRARNSEDSESPDSATDTGYRGVGAITYQWSRSAADLDASFSPLAGATTDPYNDTTAPAGAFIAAVVTATDGSYPDRVDLDLPFIATTNGAGRYYYCTLSAAGAANQDTNHNRGYRGVNATYTYQWYRSAADSDAGYSAIIGATTKEYSDTMAPAPTITAGNASASDGTSAAYVTLTCSNQMGNDGDGRYWKCELNATGVESYNTTPNRGYRGTSPLSYQWYRSAADSPASYSSIVGGTTNPYNDTGGVITPDGRYYICGVNMIGAVTQNSSSDRGYLSAIPCPPSNFTITRIGIHSINITWDIGCAANLAVIRVSDGNYPEDPTAGYLIYSGNGTYVEIDGLNLDTTTYYFRAWSWNTGGYSDDYAQGSIGGEGMYLMALIILPLGLLGFWLWKRLPFLAYGSAATWLLLAFLAMNQSAGANPTEVVDIYMALFWLGVGFCIAMVLFPTLMREKPEPEDYPIDALGDDMTSFLPVGEHKQPSPRPSKFGQTGEM